MPYMQNLSSVIVSYCKYSDWGYRKNTQLWSNVDLKLQKCNYDCNNVYELHGRRRHKAHAQHGSKAQGQTFTTTQLYRIPELLVESIYEKVCNIIEA